MRKYQQLLLVLISCISVLILLMYKNENSRLKYVLQVVNFFGRSDVAVREHFENDTIQGTEFINPLPVWQHIGGNFHAYSSFWSRNELNAGGTAELLVVGLKDSVVHFNCGFVHNERKFKGKFGFVRMDEFNKNLKENQTEFFVYKFLCKITKDIREPTAVYLTYAKSNSERQLRPKIMNLKDPKTFAAICLNLVPYNKTFPKANFLKKDVLLQFFLHHRAIGFDEFIVYNADAVSFPIRQILAKTGVNVHFLPYNFPFYDGTIKTRSIIEIDCLMRTFGTVDFVILMEPNEFLYSNSNLHFPDSVINSMQLSKQKMNRFHIKVFSVCIDPKNRLLIDNVFYDPEVSSNHELSIRKPTMRIEDRTELSLPVVKILAHNYIQCSSNKNLLYDWRSSIREDFMQYIDTVRNEISFLF